MDAPLEIGLCLGINVTFREDSMEISPLAQGFRMRSLALWLSERSQRVREGRSLEGLHI